ncbi:MAG: helix-turn-helix transcriptional regulator [Myxococcota bacterium]
MSDRFVRSLDALRRDRYALPLAARSVLIWHPSRDLRIVAGFGAVTSQDMALIVAAMGDEVQPGFPPFSSLVDLTTVTAVDPDGFNRLIEFMRTNKDAYARVNLRSAYVYGTGSPFVASAVAGYAKVVGATFPTTNHATVEDGLRALGVHDTTIAARLAELKTRAAKTFAILVPLESAIRDRLEHPSAENIADALQTSTRTLQRELASLSTTLTQEVRRVRVAEARQLLAQTDLSLQGIAARLGFASTKALREAFKRELGVSPAEWRG